jgi:hypothetical protein
LIAGISGERRQGLGEEGIGRFASYGYGGANLAAPGAVPVGLNFFHATNCVWFTDGSNNFLFVLPAEGGFWAVANNIFTKQTFLTGCVNGNIEAVNVINSSTGQFNEVFTFPST